MKEKWRPRLSLVVGVMLAAVLCLPLASLVLFRFYENQLVRQTEAELIAQGAALGAAFAAGLPDDLPLDVLPAMPTEPVDPARGPYRPVEPTLDLASDAILPPRPAARATEGRSPMAAQGERMAEVLRATQRSTLTGFRLMDPWGVVIAGGAEVGTSLAGVEEIRDAMAGRYRSVLRQRISDEPDPPLYSISRGARLRVFVAMPIVAGDRLAGVLYLSRTPSNILRHLYGEREKLALAGLAVALATLAIAFVFMRTIGRPIYELRRRTASIAAGEEDALRPLDHHGTREMAELSEAFLDMARRLETRSEAVRVFATHLSHEFKSPLTAIRGAAELLRDEGQEMPEPTRVRFLSNVLADTHRLGLLVQRLMELTRAENTEAGTATTSLAQALEAISPSPALAIDLGPGAGTRLAISGEALGIVLANLLDNARAHKAGQVAIAVHAAANGRARIDVTDDGTGVSPANRERIFEPFFTTRRESGGTGLGLGIVTALLKAHHGTIALRPTTGGAAFSIDLPLEGAPAPRRGATRHG